MICDEDYVFLLFTEANTEEDVEVKVKNLYFHASDSKIQAMLKKADLEGQNYKKEFSTKVVKGPGSYEPEYQVCFYDTLICALMLQKPISLSLTRAVWLPTRKPQLYMNAKNSSHII